MIVSVDMHRMNRIIWVDRDNLLVCMEAGTVGQDMKRRLEKRRRHLRRRLSVSRPCPPPCDRRRTIGHGPDSIEFSYLGSPPGGRGRGDDITARRSGPRCCITMRGLLNSRGFAGFELARFRGFRSRAVSRVLNSRGFAGRYGESEGLLREEKLLAREVRERENGREREWMRSC